MELRKIKTVALHPRTYQVAAPSIEINWKGHGPRGPQGERGRVVVAPEWASLFYAKTTVRTSNPRSYTIEGGNFTLLHRGRGAQGIQGVKGTQRTAVVEQRDLVEVRRVKAIVALPRTFVVGAPSLEIGWRGRGLKGEQGPRGRAVALPQQDILAVRRTMAIVKQPRA